MLPFQNLIHVRPLYDKPHQGEKGEKTCNISFVKYVYCETDQSESFYPGHSNLSLISQLNYSLLVFIATKGWIWWVHFFRWLDKPCITLSSHTILIGSVPQRDGWYHTLSCNCKLCQVSFNKTIHLNDVMKTEAYYMKWCFQSLILLGFQKKYMHRHVHIAMSVLQSYYCSHYHFLNSYPFHHCLAFTYPADITHTLSFCFSKFRQPV